MCSEFNVKMTSAAIEAALGVPLMNAAGEIQWDKTIKFATPAPVIHMTGDGAQLTERIFPISPFPNARLSGFENQSDGKDESDDEDNKQIRRIYDVPRWKTSFKNAPCLVPMTSFTEYAYWGDHAGTALGFQIPGEELFFAAAIDMKPYAPKTTKPGFSILTHTATDQMLKYHQRLIVILKPAHALGYLEEMTPQQRFAYLIENRFSGQLELHKLRNMAKGWEKRAPIQGGKLHREEKYRAALKAEQIKG